MLYMKLNKIASKIMFNFNKPKHKYINVRWFGGRIQQCGLHDRQTLFHSIL